MSKVRHVLPHHIDRNTAPALVPHRLWRGDAALRTHRV